MSQQIPDFDLHQVMTQAEEIVRANSRMHWDTAVQTVLSVCYRFPDLYPKFGQLKLFSREYINKWLKKYFDGYNNRPSQRNSKPMGTVPDEIIKTIISVRLPSLDEQKLISIKYAHRLSMSVENILGLLLEEYLSEKLLSYGWYCCWGDTIRSVDFCNRNRDLLQIKNRSNSENSSSKTVRQGTLIRKWHRIDAKTGAYYWKTLNELVGCTELSEQDFSSFIRKTITANPSAVYVEEDNVWNNQ